MRQSVSNDDCQTGRNARWFALSHGPCHHSAMPQALSAAFHNAQTQRDTFEASMAPLLDTKYVDREIAKIWRFCANCLFASSSCAMYCYATKALDISFVYTRIRETVVVFHIEEAC